ncbi:MAG: tRNA dihydrouridine(20/20a) synthase DusA [Myxococcota bacterium]|nr:tRNA dihydrouridine(20/20a) synthase DusA [Myxococcota bacterium]
MSKPLPSRRGSLYPVSIAPMMQVTNRHYRAFMRRITRHTLLYTEMITTGALLHGGREDLLEFSDEEHPVALQLGGDDPTALARCSGLAQERGFDEINLNVGCPSPRVASGRFGVSLMNEPERVADAVAAMREAVSIPVTVKHRIGVDDLDRYEDLAHFVEVVAESGSDRFIVHARKAWLQGLSPKENRTIPPLRYEDVHRLKHDFPQLAVEINGGFVELDGVEEQLERVDGVMIGRAANDCPYIFAEVDGRFFGDDHPVPTRHEVVEASLPYVEERLQAGEPLHRLVKPMLNLFAGERGSRAWKRHLSEEGHRPGAGLQVLTEALSRVPTGR